MQTAIPVEVVAHRGASAYAAEHTLAAYDLALAQGTHRLEVDVRATADGELVLVHDPSLQRTHGDPRLVGDLTAADLAALDPGARPLTLDGALGRYADHAEFLIDLKDPTPAWEAEVLGAIDRHRLRERVVVQSFTHDALRRLRAAAPWLEIAALVRRWMEPYDVLADAVGYANGIGVQHLACDAAFVDAARRGGLVVRPWTIDEPRDVERVLGLGVAGIITNAPDVVSGVLARPPALALAA